MSDICGIVDCNNKLSSREYLVKLSMNYGESLKFTYSKANTYDTFIGISANSVNKCIDNIIYRGVKYTCMFCGELYNIKELSEKIKSELGYDAMEVKSFGVIATWCYILWGGFSPKMLNGKFAYCIYSEGIFKTSPHTPRMFLARDRFGIIPIYYYQPSNSYFMFSTSIKGILTAKKEKSYIDKKGLWQIFYLDGKSLPGLTHVKDILELNAGFCAYIDCRDSCNIMKKSYLNNKKSTLFDITPDKLLDESFGLRGIDINTKKLELSPSMSIHEKIDESVKATQYPILPYIYQGMERYEKSKLLYSDIGCELMCHNNKSVMKGFFPWMRDPYSNIELIDRERLNFDDGFEFIDNYRHRISDPQSDSYYFDSIFSLYLPMTIKHIERIAQYKGINIRYPFCDNEVYSFINTKREINIESKYTPAAFELEYTYPLQNIKESDSQIALCEKLQGLVKESDSIIGYLCDNNSLLEAINSKSNMKCLALLYATHSFLEEFSLDLYAL